MQLKVEEKSGVKKRQKEKKKPEQCKKRKNPKFV